MKKIIVSLLLCVLLLAQGIESVEAAAMNSGMFAEKGLHVYLIPEGPQDMESQEYGDFWIYVEMIGENNKPEVNDAWTVEIQLEDFENEETENTDEFEISSKKTGYIYKDISLNTEHDYRNYEVRARVKDGEHVLAEMKDTAADLVLSWPSLKASSWQESLGFMDSLGTKSRAVTFAWENDALFSRLFDVTVEEDEDALEITAQSDNVWMLTLTDFLEYDVVFTLSDESDNTQEYRYTIAVVQEEFPALMKGLIVAGIVLVMLLMFLIFLRKGKNIKSIKKETQEDVPLFTELNDKVVTAKEDLDKEKKQYDYRRKEYMDMLSKNLRILNVYRAESKDFLEDYELLVNSGEKKGILDDILREYDEIEADMRFYRSNYIEWKKDGQRKSKEYLSFHRDLVDEEKRVRNEKMQYLEKNNALKVHLEHIRENEKLLQAPLDMPVSIRIEKDEELYRINVGMHDPGFLLDDKHPLNKNYGLQERSISEILGCRMGIRIASCQGKDYILVKCETQNLRKGKQIVTEERIWEANVYEFSYQFEDGSCAAISIDTN